MSKFYTHVDLIRNKIYLRGYERGRRIKEVLPYQPYLFLSSQKGDYRTLRGEPVAKMTFDNAWEARQFAKENADVVNRHVYGLTNFTYTFIYDEYPGDIDYDPKQVSTVSLDIETPTDQGFPDPQVASTPISNISVSREGQVIVFGCEFYKPKLPNVRYLMCKDEKDLLNKFLTLWMTWEPDIVTGWNIDGFDIPYLYNRIKQVLNEHEAKKLSPWGMVNEREIVRGKSSSRTSKSIEDRTEKVYELVGISVLDYLELYKKFSFSNQESYRLDYITKVELGEQKLDYSEYGSLYEFYKKDYERFVDYNIHDVVLVDKLDDKLKLIELVMAFAYDAKVNYSDVMTTVKPWDVIIHNYLLDQRVVIPHNSRSRMTEALVGGYVKEPQVGMHKWVASFDLNSLYPHLIMQYNISPETLVERVGFPSIDYMLDGHWEYRDSSVTYAANGCTYRRDKQGFLPALMEKMYDDRVGYKEKMLDAKKSYEKTKDAEDAKLVSRYHNMQLAKKIQLNSAYGALGNEYFRWFSFDNAEAITTSGQLSIRWIEKKINSFLSRVLKEDTDYVIASDTDSIYVNLGPLVEKALKDKTDQEIVQALDEFIEAKIQPYIDKCYEELADMMNARQQKMKMKRETIANKGIWKAKKMYILNAWNVEGVQYDEPKLKIQGIEAVRSSTPMACRENIKEALKIIMNKDELSLRRFVEDFRAEFNQMPFEDIAFPRGCSSIGDWRDSASIYKKGTPIHVRGALVYNHLIRSMKLQNKYQSIMNGDKVKFIYMKLPNPIRENVFSTPGELPSELGLDKYIDYDLQFEKAFIDPIKSILNVIDWDLEERSSLDQFWS
jgi:DNA polymerase elongation subunit (family B)